MILNVLTETSKANFTTYFVLYVSDFDLMPPRSFLEASTAVKVDDKIYVISHEDAAENKVLWIYDMRNNEWSSVDTEEVLPMGSNQKGTCLSSVLYVYGGSLFWKMSLPDLTVTDTDQDKNNSPSVRTGHVFTSYSNRLTLFGGYGEISSGVYGTFIMSGFNNGVNNELWSYDTVVEKWTEVNSEGPKPTARSEVASTTVGSKLYMFGGCDGNGEIEKGVIYSTT